MTFRGFSADERVCTSSGLRTALRTVAAAVLALALNCAHSQGFDPWVVRNFQVDGAQRIATGTIYNYLPLNIGDTVTDQRVQEVHPGVVLDGVLPGCRIPPGRRHAGHRGARAAFHRGVHHRGERRDQDGGSGGVAAPGRVDAGQGLRPVGAGGGSAVPLRAVLQPGPLRRQRGNAHRGHRRQPRPGGHRDRGGRPLQDPPDQRGRQHQLHRQGYPRRLRAQHGQLAVLHQE